MSDESDGDCPAVQDQPSSIPSTSPVLKVTGRQEGRPIPAVGQNVRIKVHSNTLRGDTIPDDQSALKAADGHDNTGNRPSSPAMLCRVDRIRTVSPVVEGASEVDNQRMARISPVRPPREKRLKLELSRVDQVNLLPAPDVIEPPVPQKRISRVDVQRDKG